MSYNKDILSGCEKWSVRTIRGDHPFTGSESELSHMPGVRLIPGVYAKASVELGKVQLRFLECLRGCECDFLSLSVPVSFKVGLKKKNKMKPNRTKQKHKQIWQSWSHRLPRRPESFWFVFVSLSGVARRFSRLMSLPSMWTPVTWMGKEITSKDLTKL